MVYMVGHVVVPAQQLGHNLALSIVCVAITGRLVQLSDMWWDGPPPLGGLCWEPSVASPSDGPVCSSWTEWKRPSTDPDGSSTASEKGLTHCTKISPRSVSRLRLWASWILVCALSTTPNPENWLSFTLQRMVAREWPGIIQFRTTCTPPAREWPNLSTQASSWSPISIADLLKSMRHPCRCKNGIPRMASSLSCPTMNVSLMVWSRMCPVSSIMP